MPPFIQARAAMTGFRVIHALVFNRSDMRAERIGGIADCSAPWHNGSAKALRVSAELWLARSCGSVRQTDSAEAAR